MALKSIGWDQMDNLQIDEAGRLYWKGEAVILEKRVELETYQIVLLTLGTVGAMLAGIHPFGVSFGWW